MKPYLISLSAGLLVGFVYSLLNVRSPAPPMIALVGLLGILFGEQLIPIGRRILTGEAVAHSAAISCAEPVLGRFPGDPSEPRDAV